MWAGLRLKYMHFLLWICFLLKIRFSCSKNQRNSLHKILRIRIESISCVSFRSGLDTLRRSCVGVHTLLDLWYLQSDIILIVCAWQSAAIAWVQVSVHNVRVLHAYVHIFVQACASSDRSAVVSDVEYSMYAFRTKATSIARNHMCTAAHCSHNIAHRTAYSNLQVLEFMGSHPTRQRMFGFKWLSSEIHIVCVRVFALVEAQNAHTTRKSRKALSTTIPTVLPSGWTFKHMVTIWIYCRFDNIRIFSNLNTVFVRCFNVCWFKRNQKCVFRDSKLGTA